MSKQNTGRKFFATAATAALVASAIVPVASAADFSDADQIASWAKDAVETLSAQGVISGNPDGSFNPTGNITRAQAAKMFSVALDLSTEGTENFADVNGEWFAPYVVAVFNAGIVNGVNETTFAPKANLTRAEAAKMIVEAYGLEGEADLTAFADAKTVAGKWSEGYLSTAVANKVINGKGDKLAASDSITRQEFAVMLTRAIDAVDTEEDNSAELLAAVDEATKALDTAVQALNKEVKADEIEAAKVEVATAKTAIASLEAAVEAAKDVVTEEKAAAAKEAIAAANKEIEATEAVITQAEETAEVKEEKLLAAVDEATKALDTAVEALNKEVKADEIDAAKAEVATAKTAIASLEAAVEAAKDVVTEEKANAVKEAIAAANKEIEATEAVIATAVEAADVKEDNTAKLLATVEEATIALDTAVQALNKEVKAEEIDAAKAEVATAKTAVTTLEAAVEAAKDVVTEEKAAAVKEAIVAANKEIEATEAVIAQAEEAAVEITKDTTTPDTTAPATDSVTLSSADMTGDKEITLTFSEAIASTEAAAFDVIIGDVIEDGATAAVVEGKVVITLVDALTTDELTQTIAVEPSADSSKFVVKDVAGNLLEKFDAKTVSTVNNKSSQE